MRASRRILIMGCGYVGSRLALDLRSTGDEVFGARRDPTRLPSGIVPVAVDLSQPRSLDALPRDLDAVVYCVAAGRFEPSAYRMAYVDGLRRVLDHFEARNEPVARLIFTSSTAVYARRNGERVDESSPAEPAGFSGALLLEGERIAASASPHAIVLRLAGIYGPGRCSKIDAVRSGRARLPPAGAGIGNRIHRDDAAGAIHHLLALARPESCYVGVDREPTDERALLCWIARRLGVPEPPDGDEPESASRRPRSLKRCSSDRLLASGYVFRFPTFREGYGALIDAADRIEVANAP